MVWNFREWYESNKEAFNKRRKARYHADPEYRSKVLEHNSKSRAKRKVQKEAANGSAAEEQDRRNTSDGSEEVQ